MNSIAHIEINVSDLKKSLEFYSKILTPLNWKQVGFQDQNVAGFKAKDNTHLFLVQTEKRFLSKIFHRKQTGLNHLAFRVETTEEVEKFASFLKENNIEALYHQNPKEYSSEYTEQYYAIFFEDPDQIKIEVAYCK